MITIRQKRASAVVLVGATLLASPGFANAVRETVGPGLPASAETAVAAAPAEPAEPAGAAKSPAGRFRLQELDDPLTPLVPRKPRTDDDKARAEAMAWYMTGKMLEARSEFKDALDAYRKGIKADPNAVEIYRALIPLAFSLNQTEEAVQHALKAVELDPDDFQLLRRLGVHMATQRKLPEAVQLLEKALESPQVKKESGVYVTLMRDLGILYGATGEIEKAADANEVVLEALLNPEKFELDFRTRTALLGDASATYEQIGQAFLDAKRPKLAIQAFEEAAKSRKGKPGALSFNLARVYLQTKQLDKSLSELEKYFDAQLQSKGRAAYQLLADILQEMNKSDELVERLETLAEKDPRNNTLQYFLAEQYVAQDRLEKAEEHYKKVLKDAGDSQGYAGLAGVYRRQGRAEELLDALEKAVKGGGEVEQLEGELKAIGEDDKLLEALIAAGRKASEGDEPKLDFAGSYILAKLSAKAHKTEAAVEFYRFALKNRRDRALVLYDELGEHLLEVKQYAEAAKVFEEAAADPTLAASKPNFLFRLSQAHELAGQTDKALQAIQDARKSLPDNPLLHYQEAWIHYHARRWDEAIRLFEQVIAKFPQQQEVVRRCQFSLSNIYVQQGDIKKGEEVLEKIFAEEPDNPSVNNDLGYLYADQGKNLEQAEKMIRKALAAEPENAAYLDSMGWVLYKLEKYPEAVEYLEKAADQPNGGDPTILDHLGDCYHRLDKSEKAKEAWQKALEKAKKESRPDAKLIQQLEDKLKP